MWKAARQTTPAAYWEVMDEMRAFNLLAPNYFVTDKNYPAGPEYWADAFFQGFRYGHYTSNIAKSYNSWILKARELPTLPMMEQIRIGLTKWFVDCRYHGQTYPPATTTGDVRLVDKVDQLIQESVERGVKDYDFLEVDRALGLCEVAEKKELGQRFTVDLNALLCNCLAWQISGIICDHAAAAFIRSGRPHLLRASVHQAYTVESYTATYASLLRGPPPRLRWHENTPLDALFTTLPPPMKRDQGRPQTKRKERGERAVLASLAEDRRKSRCGKCHQVGHNSRTCKR